MAFLDGRAVKVPGDRDSESLVSALIDVGLQEGWVQRFRRTPGKNGTEMLYLLDQNAKRSADRVPDAHLPEMAPPLGDAIDVIPSASSITHSVNDQQQVAKLADHKNRKYPNRASEFEAVLSKARIGGIPETRDLLFDCIEEVFSEYGDSRPTLPELFSRAVSRAKERAEANGYKAEQNWGTAERCTKRLMLWAGVLIGVDDAPIVDRIGCQNKQVAKLASDFRRICEGYLVEYIVSRTE
jgi:hypothetical protein